MTHPPHSEVENVPPRMRRAMPAQTIRPLTGRYLFSVFANWMSAQRRLAGAYPTARYGTSQSGVLTR